MSEKNSKDLLEQSLALTVQELDSLRAERERLVSEHRLRMEPLEKRINALEQAEGHQRRALHAFGVDIPPPSTTAKDVREQTPTTFQAGSKFTDVLAQVLVDAGKPMHYTALAEEVIRRGVGISAKDPGAFVINYLRREPERFCRTETPGEYALLVWNLPGTRRMVEAQAAAGTSKAKKKPRAKARVKK